MDILIIHNLVELVLTITLSVDPIDFHEYVICVVYPGPSDMVAYFKEELINKNR